MILRYFTFALILPSFFCIGEYWRVKNNVYRGEQPLIKDVFEYTNLNKQNENFLTKTLNLPIVIGNEKEWLSAQKTFNKSTGLSENIIGKIWFDICQLEPLDSLRSAVKKVAMQQLTDQMIRIQNLSFNSDVAMICRDDGVTFSHVSVNFNNRLSNNLVSNITWSDGKKMSLNWSVTYQAKTYIAKQNVMANESVSLVDQLPQWREVKNILISELAIQSQALLLSTRPIIQGTILSNRNTKLMPLIIKGDFVDVHIKKGGLSIQAKARALADGVVGEKLMVLVENAKAPIQTTVERKGVVNAVL